MNEISTELQHFTFVLLNPSANKMISAIIAESGTTIEMGLNMLFKLSGNSVRPAYPTRKRKKNRIGEGT